MRTYTAIIALSLCLPIYVPSEATERPRELTIREGEDLAIIAIRSFGKGTLRLPGFEIDPFKDKYMPGYMIYGAMWRGVRPDAGSSLGHYAVDMKDADVFDADTCEEIKRLSLRRAQIKIRRIIHLDHNEYVYYRKIDAVC